MLYLLCYFVVGVIVNMLSLFVMIVNDSSGRMRREGFAMKHLLKGLALSLLVWPYLVYRDWNG
jgi:hypothetical protein